MKDEKKTKAQLLAEIADLRQRVADLEAAGTKAPPSKGLELHSSMSLMEFIRRAPLPMAVTTRDGRLIATNDALLKTWRCTEPDVLGNSILDRYKNPADREKLIDQLSKQQKVHGFEILLQRFDGSEMPSRLSVVPLDIDGEPGFLTIGEDITEQKQTELRLRESEELYRTFFENCPINIGLSTYDGTIIAANPAFLKRFGRTLETTIGISATTLFQNPADREELIEIVKREGKFLNRNVAVRRQDGRPFTARLSMIPVKMNQKPFLFTMAEDISEQLKAQEELKNQERRFQALVERGDIAITIVDANRTITYASPSITGILGYTPDEMRAKTRKDLVHPDDQAALEKHLQKVLKSDPRKTVGTFRYLHKDGHYCWLEIFPSNHLHDPAIQGIVVHFRDVTQQKKVEEELRESEFRYRTLFESAPLGIGISDFSGRLIAANQVFRTLWGMSPEDVPGFDLKSRYKHARDREKMLEQLEKNGQVQGLEIEIARQPGESLVVSMSVVPFKVKEQTLMLAMGEDITLRKKAESALVLQEQRFRAMFEHGSEAVFLISPERKIMNVSPSTINVLGYSPEELIGRHTFDFIHPEDNPAIGQTFRGLVENPGKPMRGISRYRHKNGQYRVLEGFVSNLLHDPAVRAVIINARDVTEQKSAEENLRRSEERYRAVVEGSSLFIDRFLKDGTITFVNKAISNWIHLSREELTGFNLFKMISKEEKEKLEKVLEGLTPEHPFAENITNFISPDGHHAAIRWINSALFDEQGRIQEYMGIGEDITGKIRMEKALRESEENFRQLAENIREIFWISSADWLKVIYISPAFEKIWGFDRQRLYEDVLYWPNQIYPEDQEKVFKCMQQFRQQVVPELIFPEYRINDAKGNQRWIFTKAYPIFDEQGNHIRIAGIAEDITARKVAEEEIRVALSQKETLLRELYHRVKNNLQVIRSMLHLEIGTKPGLCARDLVRTIDQKIQAMALVHTKLYQSGDLSSLELKSYITELTGLLATSLQTENLSLKFEYELESMQVVLDAATPCGLILSELVSNAVKHGFRGKDQGHIRISLRKDWGECICLTVSDDGQGVPPGFDFQRNSTLGLKTIFAIGEQQLQGSVRFSSNPGVTCQIRFPSALYKPRI